MKGERLFRILGLVDDDLIEEADTASSAANRSRNGVTAAGFPICPMVSHRISSGLKIII